jgi:hypothetical protein
VDVVESSLYIVDYVNMAFVSSSLYGLTVPWFWELRIKPCTPCMEKDQHKRDTPLSRTGHGHINIGAHQRPSRRQRKHGRNSRAPSGHRITRVRS